MQRILLKLSGEALAGDKKTGFDEATVRDVAMQVRELVDEGPFPKCPALPSIPCSSFPPFRLSAKSMLLC